MVRKVSMLLMAVAMVLSMCGCMATVYDAQVAPDGSGTVTGKVGLTTEAMNELAAAGFDPGPLTSFTHKGAVFHGDIETAEFANADEFNELFDGLLRLNVRKESMSLVVANASEHIDEQYSDLFELGDVEIDLSDMVFDIIIEFPYPVTQSSGKTDGVEIDGKVLSLDIVTIAQNPSALAFHIGDFGLFTDVSSDAWYAAAIDYATCAGIVNGYGGGVFGPNDKLTVSALCQIIYNISEDVYEAEPQHYWAYNAIAYCLENGYVEDHGEITSANYDVAATREEAIAGLNRFLYGVDKYYPDSISVRIPDYESVSEIYRNDIRGAYYNKLVSGVDNTGRFAPDRSVTRAEFCQVYYNYNNNFRRPLEVN